MIGIDEVGRGCWAGPLVVAAVRLNHEIPGLTDSKKVSAKKRQILSAEIFLNADVGIAWVSAAEVDTNGLSRSLKQASLKAYRQIADKTGEPIVIDGNVNFLDLNNVICEPKADLNYPSVSAASIVAKVARDNFMKKIAVRYPNYGFDKHVGYGTKSHLEALEKFGVLAGIHRISFKPVKAILLKNDQAKIS